MSTSQRPVPPLPPGSWWQAMQQWSEAWWALWRSSLPQMPWPPAGTVVPPPENTESTAPPRSEEAHSSQRPAPRPRRGRSGKRGG